MKSLPQPGTAVLPTFEDRADRWTLEATLPYVAVLVLAVLALVPVLFLIYGSFVETVGSMKPTLTHYAHVYGEMRILRLGLNTLVFATGAALLALALGTSTAWIVERTNTGFRHLATIAAIVGLAIPPIVKAMAWILLLAPRSGYVHHALAVNAGVQMPIDIYSMAGLIWVGGLQGAPFAFLLLSAAFRSMDRTLEEAAAVAGARTARTLFGVTLPLAAPAALSVLLYTLIGGIESFEIPALIGTPARIPVLTTRIYEEVEGALRFGRAAAYAAGVLLLGVIAVYAYSRAIRRTERFATITGRGYRPGPAPAGTRGSRKFVAGAVVLFYVTVVALLPVLALVWTSVTGAHAQPSVEAIRSVTLASYVRVFRFPLIGRAVRNTLMLASLSGLIVAAFTAVAGWVVVRGRGRLARAVDTLGFLPYVVPGIVLGVAILWFYLTVPVPIYGTIWILLIGYVTVTIPVGMRYAVPAVSRIHPDLEDSAAVSGAAWRTRFAHVVLPLILPAVLAAGVHTFILVARMVSIAALLYSSGSEVLPMVLFTMWNGSPANTAAALAVLLLVALLPLAFAYRYAAQRVGVSVESPWR